VEIRHARYDTSKQHYENKLNWSYPHKLKQLYQWKPVFRPYKPYKIPNAPKVSNRICCVTTKSYWTST
jgi:hypothetical protein